MSSPIGKREIEHLAKLARIELTPHEEEKFLKELPAILEHFQELQKIDTSAISPMAGGTDLENAFRADDGAQNTNRRAGIEGFPESQDGYLKVPPVFE